MDRETFKKRKEMIQALMCDPNYTPMKIKELAILLQVPREQREELKEVLDALLAEGKIGISKRGKYGRPEDTALVGIFTGTAKGFGFVTVEGMDEDIYIHESNVDTAMHGDTVQVAVIESGRGGHRTEGKILRVLERAFTDVVGTFHKSKHYGFVVPENQRIGVDIFIPEGKDMGVVNGHKVVAHIKNYGDQRHSPEGEIIEILGHVNDPGVDITAVVRAYGIPDEFPPEVMEQTAQVGESVDTSLFKDRLDLRDWQMVTIDGEDAKDLDDAVSVTRNGDGYVLGVHIADVSQYVPEDSPLDKEARTRGTSVYLTDRVIPMLPHRLSNGICSLNAGEDRLALSCIMDIGADGTIQGHRIAETLIRVNRRMSYTAVAAVLDGDEAAQAEYAEEKEMFFLMKELADKLRRKRRKRGSIDFDLPECKIILDEKGRPVDIHPYERNAATDIIEDFMLAANETVAEDYFWQELPFVYRTHDKPDPEKVSELAALLRPLGAKLHTSNGELHPKELQKLLADIADRPEEAFISRLALRSMKQARYSIECTGHFGLAAKYYCHFTSPIRRYPDLQIHRIIKENLRGTLDEKRVSHYSKILHGVADSSSKTERRATEAERMVNKMKMAQFMQPKIGECFDGMISGVTRWGMYVELPDTIEGLVHVNNLIDDYYSLDEKRHELVGEMTGRRFRMGEPVRVRLVGVDLHANTIDFILVEPEDEDDIFSEGTSERKKKHGKGKH